jgi:hypothetical protein
MQDLERLNDLESPLKRFNALQNETDIHAFHDFCNSDDGKFLFNTLSQSPNYSHLKEFERIIPFFIDAKISQSLKEVKAVKDLQSKDLGLKDLLGDDRSVEVLETKLKDEIASKMGDGKSAQESFNEVKKSSFWQKILDWLSIFVSVNAQLKNATSTFVQQKLQERKKELVSQIENFDKNFPTKVTETEISKSANNVGVFKKGDKTVYIKGIDSIKAGFYGAVTGVKNEGIRELFGAEFMREMGITNAPKIELIEEKGTTKKIVSYKVGNEGDTVASLGSTLGAPEGLKRLSADEKVKVSGKAKEFFDTNESLKEKVMELHAISYLIGNRDLHVNNIMVVTDQEGRQSVAPIDFGLSGHDMKVLDSWYYKTRFDTANMRHSDADTLFEPGEYKSTFSSVLENFERNKESILGRVFYQCRAAGASDTEISALRANIEANVIAGKKFCQEKERQISF